jgi:hypothetical protein
LNTPKELEEFISDPENRLIQTSEMNDMKVTVRYKPTALLVYQELGDRITDTAAVSRVEKKYNDYLYFILSISRDQGEILQPATLQSQYGDLVQTLSFRMNNFANLTTNIRDTIPVADFILNRTFGMSNSTDLLFVFSKTKCKDSEWVQFNLNEFGLGLGNQRFRFNVDDLDRVQKLRFKMQEG